VANIPDLQSSSVLSEMHRPCADILGLDISIIIAKFRMMKNTRDTSIIGTTIPPAQTNPLQLERFQIKAFVDAGFAQKSTFLYGRISQ
jgi:hypothetical protein